MTPTTVRIVVPNSHHSRSSRPLGGPRILRAARVGGCHGRRRQQAGPPRHRRPVPLGCPGQGGDVSRSPVARLARRPVEAPLVEERRRPTHGLLRAGLRRLGLEDDPRSLQPGALGYGVPIYTNIGYPFGTPRPPFVPREMNSVGSYRTTLRGAGVLEGAARSSSPSTAWPRRSPLGEREEGRLQRGQPDARRVRPDRLRTSRGRTCSPSRSTGTRTAATSNARTSGASRASSAAFTSGPEIRSTSATSAS